MKAAIFAFLAFAASALASPAVLSARQSLDAESAEIDRLTTLITQHTANISKNFSLFIQNPLSVSRGVRVRD